MVLLDEKRVFNTFDRNNVTLSIFQEIEFISSTPPQIYLLRLIRFRTEFDKNRNQCSNFQG